MLLRDGPTGLEVLLVRRGRDLVFGGGAWVFPGGRVDPSDGEEAAIAVRRAAVRETAEETGLLVDPDDLLFFAHWTTPPGQPRRFATSFFAAAAREAEVVVDGSETTHFQWLSPGAALAALDAGEIRMLPPTFVTLRDLAGYETVADALGDLAVKPIRVQPPGSDVVLSAES